MDSCGYLWIFMVFHKEVLGRRYYMYIVASRSGSCKAPLSQVTTASQASDMEHVPNIWRVYGRPMLGKSREHMIGNYINHRT